MRFMRFSRGEISVILLEQAPETDVEALKHLAGA
jgi:hypothetical protein